MMLTLETPGELADARADLIGIYGACDANGDVCQKDKQDCGCRVGWVPYMADRIRDAVRNERLLERAMGYDSDR